MEDLRSRVMRRGRATRKAMTSAMSSAVMATAQPSAAQPSGTCVGDVVGQLGCHGAWLDDHHADVGLQLLAQCLRPAAEPPLGRGVDRVAGPGGATGHRRDVTRSPPPSRSWSGIPRSQLSRPADWSPPSAGFVFCSEETAPSSITPALLTRMSAPPSWPRTLSAAATMIAVGDVGFDGERAVAVRRPVPRRDRCGGQKGEAMAVGQCAGGGLADAR